MYGAAQISTAQYPPNRMFIDGNWIEQDGDEVIDPATETAIGHFPVIQQAQLGRAIEAAERGSRIWRETSPARRADIMLAAARLLRGRVAEIARIITLEQGKTLKEASDEVFRAADLISWDAEEGRRAYGRIVPGKVGYRQQVIREPVGPIAAFTPWSAPTSSPARKLGGALAAGCSVVLKASEETPGGACALVRCFEEAGLPPGIINLVFGDPDEISRRLIGAPAIRLITFTGSVPVGMHLAKLAAGEMKPAVMELGGHSPVIVCADVDPEKTAVAAVRAKFRNAGQVCISPTRFLVHSSIFDRFARTFVEQASAIRVGNGLDASTQMGPLANPRRLKAMEDFVADATKRGANLLTGGRRVGQRGYFFSPTVLADVPSESSVMRTEPFGPIALLLRFDDLDDAIREANRLPYALAAYAFTDHASTAARLASEIEVGHLAINHFGGGIPESPFGGVKQSGLGREGGREGVEAYQVVKFVTHRLDAA